MKIRKIKIKNYKIFDDLELDFTDSDGNTLDTIVLAGINGSGKTSVLQLLQKIFSKKPNCFKIEENLATFDKDIIICEELAIEFESSLYFIENFENSIASFRQSMSKINIGILNSIYYVLDDISNKLSLARETGNLKFTLIYKTENNGVKFEIKKNDFIPFGIFLEDDILKYFSVLYFVASSFDININLDNNKSIFDAISTSTQSYESDGIVKLVDIFSHKEKIEEYFVNFIVNAVLENRDLIVKDAVDCKIRDVNEILKKIKLNTKLIDITSEKAIFESLNGKKISIDDLSSGEKQLFYRATFLSKLNINNSLILVDEPETSLHPSWQREIIKLYQNAGENNQVILATHSPHIMASVEPKNLFVLYFDDEENKVKVMNMEKEQKYTKGVEPNRILQEVMGFELRDEETQKCIDDIVTILRKNPEERDTPDFEEKLQQLIHDLGVQDPSIMRIKNQLFLLNRKK